MMQKNPVLSPRDTTIMDELLLGKETDHVKINMPRTNEFVLNNRNQCLHVRSLWPASAKNPYDVNGIVLSLHGYGSQANRPTHRYLGERLNAENKAYITIDFAGHGYSEGLRGQVLSVDDIIDDALFLVLALFGEPSIACSLKYRFSTNSEPDKVKRVPQIFMMGHSMGGGTAIVVSYLLAFRDRTKDPTISTPFYNYHRAFIQANVTPHFCGGIYVCPVIRVTSLSRWFREILVGTLSDLFPFTIVPLHWGDDDDENHPSWASAKYRKYTHADGYPHNPRGLTYADSISFRTMYSILVLNDYVQSVLEEIDFPFLLLHDPTDTIVPYVGSTIMMQRTIRVPEDKKRLIVADKMLHDILANDAINASNEILSFLARCLEQTSTT